MMKYFHFVSPFVVEIISLGIQFLVSATAVIDYGTRIISSYENFDVVCKFYNINRNELMYAYE